MGNKANKEESKDAQNISRSPLIECVETYPPSAYSNVGDLYSRGNIWKSAEFAEKSKKNGFLIFNLNDVIIDTVSIKLNEEHHASTIKLFSCDEYKEDEWNSLFTKRGIKKAQYTQFYLKSNHAKFVKICIENVKSTKLGIDDILWKGVEPNIKNEITHKLNVYQSSSINGDSNANSVLNLETDASFMSSFHDTKPFLIFDCKRYEIEQIFIEFGRQSKPETIKLRMNHIGNAYSFHNAPTLKTWKLETGKTRDHSKEWSMIHLKAILSLNDIHLYQNGFNRYLQLEFSQYVSFTFDVINCRFFGRLSERISVDSEQFDPDLDDEIDDVDAIVEEGKENDTKYKPKIIDFTSPQKSSLNYPISNVFDDSIYSSYNMKLRCYSEKGTEYITGFIIIDLGNNAVDHMWILSHYRYPCEICRVLTGDDAKGKQWSLLHEDNDFMDPAKFEHGVEYDVRDKHKKYIKLEFEKSQQPTYGVKILKFFGDSPFLDKKKIELTLDDIENMQPVDEDLVHKYKMQEKDKIILKNGTFEVAKLNQRTNEWWTKKKFGKQWIDENMDHYTNNAKKCYINTQMNAYIQPTKFEEQQLLNVCELQKEVAEKYAIKILEAEADENKEEDDLMQQHISKEEEYNAAVSNNEDEAVITTLKRETEALLTQRRQRDKIKGDLMIQERDNKLNAIYKDRTTEDVYDSWKESVEQHPMTISDKYTVIQYDTMIKWATKHKPEEIKQLFKILAKLLKQSMEQRIALIHKYHLFQLSVFPFDRDDCSEFHGAPPIWLLFDAKDRKLDRMEFELCGDASNIELYTANEIIEKKNDNQEEETDWSNFTKIQQVMIPDKYFNIGSDEIPKIPLEVGRCNINLMNERYIKVMFLNRFGFSPSTYFRILQFRAYVESKNDEEVDDVAKEGVLPKHRLKLIRVVGGDYETANKNAIRDRKRRRYNEFKYIYLSKTKGYTTESNVKQPFFIFDSGDPLRKIERFEIEFGYYDGKWKSDCYFDSFVVSTSSTLNDLSDNQDNKDNEEWNELYHEETKGDELWEKCYDGKTKVINLDCNNMRYLKFSFNLSQYAEQIRLLHLKFYTNDPPEYQWESDRNIKNLTKQIEIVNASCYGTASPESMYNDEHNKYYEPLISKWSSNWNWFVRENIRDEICCALNKLRFSGSITNDEKHFIKFLLCWQNPHHYEEILEAAKRLMNLLRKPLVSEYKRLQEEKSEILTLQLNEEYRLPSDIVSNHGLLQWQYNKWYKYRSALFYPNDLNEIAEEWTKLGLKLNNAEFKHLRRIGIVDKDKSFTSSDELVMDFLNLVAIQLDPSFQETMKNLFEENRKTLELKYPTDNVDLGRLSGPIKSKARQIIKVKLDYSAAACPQCMSVLDIVRCAIVCEDDKELCSLFHLICDRFKGKILRIKNAFDDVNKGTYGYRAVLINIAYGDNKILPNEFKIICEVQLLLNSYYQVRKLMHLGYGIVRSEEGGISDNRKPYMVLAQDSCKLGKLDI